MTAYQKLALAATFATYALVIMGGVVRVTGSGLGCPDWPLCHGQVIPPLEKPVLIEYAHRLAATATGLLVVALAVATWVSHRRFTLLVVAASAAVVVLVFQALLGGVTVVNELPPSIVTAHMATAMLLLALLLLVTSLAFLGPQRAPAAIPWLPVVAALATYGLVLTGSYVVGQGASISCDGWPLCNGELVPGEGGRVAIQFLHRLTAAAIGVLVTAVAIQAWRQQPSVRPLLLTATLALGIYMAQVLLGASNIWFRLAPGVRAAHLGAATGLWMTLVVHCILAYRLRLPDQARRPLASAEGRREVAKEWAR